MKTTHVFNIETFSRKAWRAMEAGETFYGYENGIGFGFEVKGKMFPKRKYFIAFLDCQHFQGNVTIHGETYPEIMESLDKFMETTNL